MQRQSPGDDFYEAGKTIGNQIKNSTMDPVSSLTLQALIGDLLADHNDIQEALKSIVARPGFQQLIQLADSKRGEAQKSAFLEALKRTYSQETIESTDSLICGILSLSYPEEKAQKNKENSKDFPLIDQISATRGKPQKHEANVPPKSKNLLAQSDKSSTKQKDGCLPLVGIGLVAAFYHWALPYIKLPHIDLGLPQKPSSTVIPASKMNWEICRAAQDIRPPQSTYGENIKPLKDGLGRFPPAANTKQSDTWFQYSCSEISGIYEW